MTLVYEAFEAGCQLVGMTLAFSAPMAALGWALWLVVKKVVKV